MDIQITVLSVNRIQAITKAGKPYEQLEVAYKSEDGQVRGKKIMPFGDSKPVFDVLSKAQATEVYNIDNQKIGDYWNWMSIKLSENGEKVSVATGATPSAASARAPAGKVSGSNYETPEERAKKQVYIVRQSSITAALNMLGAKAKTSGDVISVAKEFEAFVFDLGTKPAAVKLDTFEDDIPQ